MAILFCYPLVGCAWHWLAYETLETQAYGFTIAFDLESRGGRLDRVDSNQTSGFSLVRVEVCKLFGLKD